MIAFFTLKRDLKTTINLTNIMLRLLSCLRIKIVCLTELHQKETILITHFWNEKLFLKLTR